MAKRIFGELAAHPIGSLWETRLGVSRAGVHRPPMNGICGTASEGCESIVISGGYEDDEDYGLEIVYTGTGGYDVALSKQIADQTFENTNNASLIVNQLAGTPIRVIRGSGGDPDYSPHSGFRYDGLFKVEDHWIEKGKSGFLVCRFRLTELSKSEVIVPIPKSALFPPRGESNPRRIKSVATRIVRTTAVAEYVKKLHNFTCQICSIQIAIPKGLVAEGAHIRALGKPHNGPDTTENILCLCPNHHTSFDLGGIYIGDDLRVFNFNDTYICDLVLKNGHSPGRDHLAYHRSLWKK